MRLIAVLTLTTWLAGIVPASAKDLITVKARHASDSLVVGESHEIILEVTANDGYSAAKGGIPGPLVQIEVPEGVVVSGKEMTSYRELARNEFLQAPYERLLVDNPARIGFQITSAAAPDDVIALNVIAYVGSETDDEDVTFVRQRWHLALTGGAEAKPADPTVSDWGKEDVLQIGDKAELFTLPKADGDKVALADFIGKKNVIVTTYRAHW